MLLVVVDMQLRLVVDAGGAVNATTETGRPVNLHCCCYTKEYNSKLSGTFARMPACSYKTHRKRASPPSVCV